MIPAKINGTTAMEANPSTITGPVIEIPHVASFYGMRSNGIDGSSFPHSSEQDQALPLCCQFRD